MASTPQQWEEGERECSSGYRLNNKRTLLFLILIDKEKASRRMCFYKSNANQDRREMTGGKQKSPEQGCPRFVGTGATFQTTRTKWSILRTNRWWFGLDDSSCPVFYSDQTKSPTQKKGLMTGFISLYVCVCTLARLGHLHSVAH